MRKGDGGALLQRGHWLEPDAADGVKCEGTEKVKRCLRLPNEGVLHVASGVGGTG